MFLRFLIAGYLIPMAILYAAETNPLAANHETLIAETHTNSLKLRDASLRKTIAKGTVWPDGVWGDNLWTLSALYLNEKTAAANARILTRANEFIAKTMKNGNSPAPTPEEPGNAPWTFFSITDYVRTLYLFHSKSTHFPGRLKAETEAAMKEALWLWVRGESRIEDAGSDDMFYLLGTENHDLNKRPNYYLVTSLLKDDPAYRDRKLADGHTVTAHAAAHKAYFRNWPLRRAATGLWAEVGSNTYQKYSWPALFNLHDLSPDPLIRKNFGLLLDLAFIEEEQISVRGRRGGGRSRAYAKANGFEAYKNLLYAPTGQSAGCSHSKVIETTKYQLPPEAILLRYRTFPVTKPFVIRNRVLGELEQPDSAVSHAQRLAPDSALINYVYRTSHFLLGSTLQNPALCQPNAPEQKYAGISRQNRVCGMLFDDPSAKTISQVYPIAEHTGGGRSQNSYWSVQQENILILQRIPRLGKSTLGSYNTGKFGIYFEGADLTKSEKDGWIFATNGKAFVAVKFLDSPHEWDEKNRTAYPKNFKGPEDNTRILLFAGDITTHENFEKFQAAALTCRLSITPEKIETKCGPSKAPIVVTRYDPKAPKEFSLPLINGHPIDLRPATTFAGPFLNSTYGSHQIKLNVGPFQRTIDFSSQK